MRLGIYGGTFNPIHIGHVHLIKGFIQNLALDKVLIIPTGMPPHKEANQLATAEQRIAMCELAVQGIPQAEISRIETNRSGKSYTVQTLTLLKKQYPTAELFLLMGEDMFLTVEKWFQAKSVFSLCTIAAAPRSHAVKQILAHKIFLEQKFGAAVTVEQIPYQEVSSTQVRVRAAAGESLDGLVPPLVAAYIKEQQIYTAGRV